ncbi:MAG: lipoate--protein ligase [Treponema sp.]|nr:lipoate--protein ligase [Treponema sp.]
MNYYIESRVTDPAYNLALEQFVFDSLDRANSYIMLWQNHSSIIVGKNQNTSAEVNASFVNANNISVVRRLSGGGAVYHDLGNLNYTFITDASTDNIINIAVFCKPILEALNSFGVPAEIKGRNDMTIEDKKISGNAQYIRKGRVLHHGTLLYDSCTEMLTKALNVSDDKIESKGIKSIKSRVSNIRPFMKNDMSINEFWDALKKHLFIAFEMKEYCLSPSESAEIQKLRENRYSKWEWNYGASPAYNIRKNRRIEGCGNIEILLDVEKHGVIKNAAFFGDFFGNSDTSELAAYLSGCRLEYDDLKLKLGSINLSRYFHNINEDVFISLLLE